MLGNLNEVRWSYSKENVSFDTNFGKISNSRAKTLGGVLTF